MSSNGIFSFSFDMKTIDNDIIEHKRSYSQRECRYYTVPILLALFYIVFLTPLMGRKNGYTVDATANFRLTKEIVQTGNPLPDIAVKQGYMYSIVYIPFYLLGDFVHSLIPEIPSDYFQRKSLCWMNTVITGITLGVLSILVRLLGFSRPAQVFIPLIYGFSTFAFAYARYDYNKCLAALFLLLSFYFIIKLMKYHMTLDSLLAGLFLALLVTIRLELGVVFPVFFYQTMKYSKSGKHKWLDCGVFLFPVALGVAFVIVYNFLYWGGEVSGGYETGFQLNPFPAIAGFLTSPGKSIFIFNPVVLLLPLVIRPFREKCSDIFWFWAETLIVLLLLYSFWGNWWGGWGFGPRHLVPFMPLLVLPLSVIPSFPSRTLKICAVFLAAVGTGVQLIGSAIDFNDVIYTLMKAGITEHQLIWNPIVNPVFQHILFISNIPFNRWDFALFAWYSYFPALFYFGIVIVWLLCLSLIGYRLMGYACSIQDIRDEQ